MSGTLILKNGLLAAACVAGLTLTACASGQSSSSRYGSVYDYESGGNSCTGPSCGVVTQPYAGPTIGGQPISPGVVYANCGAVSGMNCNQQQNVEIYSPPVNPAPIACPTGTTSAGNGTCMQSGNAYGYTSTTTTTNYAGGEIADCPAGTVSNGDGTCMQSGSSYDFESTTSVYSGTSYSGETADCPAGTTATGNGTCMEVSGGNVEIYNNTGYTPPSTYTPPTTYLPIRK